jgi:hypothetical protein
MTRWLGLSMEVSTVGCALLILWSKHGVGQLHGAPAFLLDLVVVLGRWWSGLATAATRVEDGGAVCAPKRGVAGWFL